MQKTVISKSSTFNSNTETLPDLFIDSCPFGCNVKCARIWINKSIKHRIICHCKACHNNEKEIATVYRPSYPVAVAIHSDTPKENGQ
jgi:hypothetical protein